MRLDDQIEYLNEWLLTQQIKHDYLNDFLYIESLNTFEDYLVRNDKLGMAHSMEGRFPY